VLLAAASLAFASPSADSGLCRGLTSVWVSRSAPTDPVKVWYDGTLPGQQARADLVASAVRDEIWPALVERVGLPAPRGERAPHSCDGGDGRLDVYLVPQCEPHGTLVREPTGAYLRLCATQDEEHLRASAAHQLMHAIQYTAYGLPDTSWIAEPTATWAEDAVYARHIQAEHPSAPCYLDTTELSLTAPGQCAGGLTRGHGAYVFFQFLAHTQGEETVRAALAATAAQPPGAHALETLASVVDFDTVWPKFAEALARGVHGRALSAPPLPVDPGAPFPQWDGLQAQPSLSTFGISPQGGAHRVMAPIGALPAASVDLAYIVPADLGGGAIDPNIRSVLVHNPWFVDHQQGKGVHVTASWHTVDGDWVIEDWTGEEWVGFCRDFRNQRFDQLVIAVSNA
jgi:hypothetical protein